MRKRRYDQTRYLDDAGMEVARIDFNKGRPGITGQDRLQNKAGATISQIALKRIIDIISLDNSTAVS